MFNQPKIINIVCYLKVEPQINQLNTAIVFTLEGPQLLYVTCKKTNRKSVLFCLPEVKQKHQLVDCVFTQRGCGSATVETSEYKGKYNDTSLYSAVGLCLQDDAAAAVRVVLGVDLVFVSVDVVDVHAFFPLVVYFSNGDQLHSLPLRDAHAEARQWKKWTFWEILKSALNTLAQHGQKGEGNFQWH